jgi:hypothetical protein
VTTVPGVVVVVLDDTEEDLDESGVVVLLTTFDNGLGDAGITVDDEGVAVAGLSA